MFKSFCCCTTGVSGHYCGIAPTNTNVKPIKCDKKTEIIHPHLLNTNTHRNNQHHNNRHEKENCHYNMSSDSVNIKSVQQNVEYFSNFQHSTPVEMLSKSLVCGDNLSNEFTYSTSNTNTTNTNTTATKSIHFYHPKSIHSNNLTSITHSNMDSCNTTRSSLGSHVESLVRSTATLEVKHDRVPSLINAQNQGN